MAPLKIAVMLKGLFPSGWLFTGFLTALGSIAGGSYYVGHKHATTAYEVQKQASINAALERVLRANSEIGDIRVEAERTRAADRAIFDDLEESFSNVEYLQELLIDNDCELDLDRLRLINGAILRASESNN